MADTALDLSEFEALIPQHGPRCATGRALSKMDDADRAKMEAAMAAEHIPTSAIVKWCKARELSVGDHSIKRHRRGECACSRD